MIKQKLAAWREGARQNIVYMLQPWPAVGVWVIDTFFRERRSPE